MATSNLRDLMPPAPEKMDIAGSVEAGVQTGIKLATAKEQVEASKLKLEEMKNDLAVKQASTANSLISNLVNASPVIAKKMLPQVRQRFIQLGLDPDVADLVVSDDNYRANASALTATLGGKLTANPQFAQQYIASLRQAGLTDQAIQQYIMAEHNRASQMALMQEKTQAAESKAAAKPAQPSVGQKARDVKFAKEYADFFDAGGASAVISNLNSLKESLDTLESGGTTQLEGLVPDMVGNVAFPQTANVRTNVTGVLIQGLKDTFGGQLSDGERRAMVESAYVASADPKDNANRVRALMQKIKSAALAKEAAAQFFEDNGGSLEGYKGTRQFNLGGKKLNLDPTPDLDKEEFVDDTGDAADNEPAAELDMQEIENMVKQAMKRNPQADPEKLRQAIIKKLGG